MTEPGAFEPFSPRRRTMRPVLIAMLVAFLVGLAVMAAVAHRYGDRWFAPEAAPVAAPSTAVQTPATAMPQDSGLPALQAREIQLAQRIQMLEARLSNIDSDSRVASTFATRAEGLLVAFAARRALDRGLGLGYIEGQLRERFGAVEPRATGMVISAARQPVTLESLRIALDTLAPDLMSGTAQESWGDALRRELSNLIVLREEGSPSPRPTERLTRARRMLDAGQVEAALAEISRLPGAERAASWTDAARRYIDARAALDTIETTALQGGGFSSIPAAMPTPPQALPASPLSDATATSPLPGAATTPMN